ncbi:MAG: 3-ketoacyl-ACP reductase [Terriglobia bacterium]
MKPLVALVTGGSRGIGRGICVELARAGHSVAINYVRDQAAAIECERLCRQAAPASTLSGFEVIQADISTREGRGKLLDSALEKFGWIDMLVNNAGIAPRERMDLLETSEESMEQVMETNVKGPFFLTQALAKIWLSGLASGGRDRPKPRIVTITSISAYTTSVNRAEYCMSKAALSMATQSFAARLAEHGINVYEVRPGVIRTDMTKPVEEKYDRLIEAGLTPIRRWGMPEDVGLAVAAIAENRLPFSTGEVINVDGGFHLRVL